MDMKTKAFNQQKWWKNTVIYQVYPRSFLDTNGDGIGDLPGVTKKLDYLKDLGIGAIWLSPVCKSPQHDNGYDISDYMDIDPLFGSLQDMDELIAEAKKRDIKIVLDMVLNHSSNEHPWFLEAKKSRDNPYHDFYIWRDGTPEEAPNDHPAIFGGLAWEYVPELGQYYLHHFLPEQPDLNWENPVLRNKLYEMIHFWINKGVGGFRLDVIDHIAKQPDLKIMSEGKGLHDYIREMTAATFSKADLVTVGEAWSATTETSKLWSNPDGSELSMIFQFEHVILDQIPGKQKWDLAPFPFLKFKKVLSKWQTELYDKGWNSLFFGNHDMPRSVSNFGNDKDYWVESAKMLALVLHGMQGTPYIYQGEELGMTNVSYAIEDYQDVEILNMYKERLAKGYSEAEIMASIHAKGRDNARTPMQWTNGENAGFTEAKPWIKVNPNYLKINAQSQISDPDSIYSFYKRLIALRKSEPLLIDGEYALLLAEDEQIFAYTRNLGNESLLVIANFTGAEVSYDDKDISLYENGKCLISNYDSKAKPGRLRPYEARIYK